MRRFFRVLNRFFMVPMFRLGMGPFFGNPLSGYVMVLRTIGRKSGRVRNVPVNCAIHRMMDDWPYSQGVAGPDGLSTTDWIPYTMFGWTDTDADGIPEILDSTPYGTTGPQP